MYSLECGHKFCRRCWVQYLTQKIVEEGLSQSIKCLQPNCGMLVDDENVVMLINDDSEVMSKYHRSMTIEFVVVRKYTNFVIKLKLKLCIFFFFLFLQHNKTIQWCPSADCSHAAKKITSTANNMPWSCKCGYDFCFDCMEYWHEPVSCARLIRWKNSDDSESRKWIVEHSKPCPQCKASIEKNGGCNHMVNRFEWKFSVRCFMCGCH